MNGKPKFLRSNPGGAAAVFFHYISLYEHKIEVDRFKEMSFDEMVERARGLLFGSEIPSFESKFAKNHSPLDAQAEVSFYLYQQGVCLDCPALTDNADRSDKKVWAAHRLLRTLLGLFDQNGEPIPNKLREWSAQSRLKAPQGKPGRPPENWLRNACIVHAVADLAYVTGKNPTRNEASPEESPCDAVAEAFKREGLELPEDAVPNAWTRKKKGSKHLERLREASQFSPEPRGGESMWPLAEWVLNRNTGTILEFSGIQRVLNRNILSPVFRLGSWRIPAFSPMFRCSGSESTASGASQAFHTVLKSEQK